MPSPGQDSKILHVSDVLTGMEGDRLGQTLPVLRSGAFIWGLVFCRGNDFMSLLVF